MRPLLISFFILLSCIQVFAQDDYTPSEFIDSRPELMQRMNQSEKDQLSWANDLPKDQKKIALQHIKDRSELLRSMLKNGNFIFDSPLNDIIIPIFQKILQSNPDLDQHTVLLLSRSGSVNAFTTGDGFLVLNIGLLAQLKDESELAFIIGHELGHQALDHVNQKLHKKIELDSDTERQKEIKRILRSEYQVHTQLQNLLLPGMISSREFSRSNEFQADSLGFLFATRSGFSPKGAIAAMQMLNNMDEKTYENELPWEILFEQKDCQYSLHQKNASTGSSLGSFQIDQDIVEKLKTHPDCDLRIAHIENIFKTKDDSNAARPFETARLYSRIELIENYLKKEDLGAALFHALHLYVDYPESDYAKQHVAYCLGMIAYFKKQRQAGKYIQTFSEYFPTDYGNFLNTLWKLSATECNCLAYKINAMVMKPGHEERNLAVRAIAAYNEGKKEEAKKYASEYIQKYPNKNHHQQMNYILNLK